MSTQDVTSPDSAVAATPALAPESAGHRFWRHAMEPPLPDAEMTPAQKRYEAISGFPMFTVALLWILSLFFTWVPAIHAMYGRTGLVLSLATWCVFLLDVLIRFTLDPRKSDFFKRNWPLLTALVLPPLRILLVGSAVLRVQRDRNTLTKIVGLYAAYLVVFVVLLGGVITFAFEINAPGSTLRSFGDAVWWGFETVTTVGYGDFTPVTVAGRAVAVVIMFSGAASVGAVTAALASRFMASSSQSSGQSSGTPNPSTPAGDPSSASTDDLARQLEALHAQVEQIAAALGVRAQTQAEAGASER